MLSKSVFKFTMFYKSHSKQQIRENRFHRFLLANFGPVDCLSTRLFLDGPKIAEEFEVRKFTEHNSFIAQATFTTTSETCSSDHF